MSPADIYQPGKLREWRAATGKRREEVAVDLGISSIWVKQVENAERMPSLQLLTRMAEYYGHTLHELLVPAHQQAS